MKFTELHITTNADCQSNNTMPIGYIAHKGYLKPLEPIFTADTAEKLKTRNKQSILDSPFYNFLYIVRYI